MRRREFIAVLCSAATQWPLAALAQPEGRVRQLGVMMPGAESDPVTHAYAAALRQKLEQLGWIESRNLRLHLRFDDGDLARTRRNAEELVGLAPDVLVVTSVALTRALQEQTRTIPIVFVQVGDPVASRVVRSIAHPGGNTTGITNLFPSIAGKWLELLKEAAPQVARVALIFNPELFANEPYLAEIEAAAAALSVKVTRSPVRGAAEIERAIDAVGAEPNGALILVPPPPLAIDRELILRLARLHRLPAIVSSRLYAAEGGLISYGPDTLDLYRGVASYVDRILRGAKPGELPVQFPTKFELVINLKAASAIGLTIPESLLFRADEVIR
jgi:putative ABC transport system substrate-binding protein